MALPIWPSILPTPKLPIDIQPDDPLARTDMEDGPPRARRVRTLVLVDYTATVEFTALEMRVFEAWHHHYLIDGAEWFSMPLPCGKGIYSAEVKFKSAPKHSLIEGGVFRVNLELQSRNRPFLSKTELDAMLNP